MDKPISEQQSLQIIQQMIENSKVKFSDNSYFFILWGWLVLIASVLQFVLIEIEYPKSYLVWPVLMAIGGVFSGIEARKLIKGSRVKTAFGTVMSYLWGGYSVCICIIISIIIIEGLGLHLISIFIMVLSGLATLVTGAALGFTPLKLGGVSCWLLLMPALFAKPEYSLLFSGASMISAYLVPGYLLKYKVKRNV